MFRSKFFVIFINFLIFPFISSFPEQGKFDAVLNLNNQFIVINKTLFAGSQIFVKATCQSANSILVNSQWYLEQQRCWQEAESNDDKSPVADTNVSSKTLAVPPKQEKCTHDMPLDFPTAIIGNSTINSKKEAVAISRKEAPYPIFTIPKDGLYKFCLHISPNQKDAEFNASIHIEMRASYGYLSAAEWPLLPFYGAMCLVYVILGTIWLVVSFMQWRDLLRIQFWIGGVILLGMLEKAVFYAEYQNINSTGVSVQGAVLLAEWVSCAKRTLARMLVIIVSLGFGIVKPRLGPMLHRVVGTGALYFILACVESYLRVMQAKSDQSNQGLLASIPLAFLDSAISWWIFTSLVQTTRTLRLRRNMVKLSLYRHFTNTLIFSVLASVVFMLYSIKVHQLNQCLVDWKEIWVDDAFWHVLFSVLLLVIMILWRPTNNNQRYAFTPLLDNPEDEDDDEEEQFVSDAYGVKMRGSHANSIKPQSTKATTTEEDDLRWVEENIPTAIADAALPVLDSDEEIINTKFEVSKMQ